MKISSYETMLRELLRERRDYGEEGRDQLEQNAIDLLSKGNKLPIELEHQLMRRDKQRDCKVEAVIKKCPKKVQDDRPKSEQQWCLFDSEGEKLLGRHPTKEDALAQERAIQIHKRK